ncbi:MAG: HD domain-containing phosphohydrolase [Pseudomonadales bacterium]
MSESMSLEMEMVPELDKPAKIPGSAETASGVDGQVEDQIEGPVEGVQVSWKQAARERSILFVDDDERFLNLCVRRFAGTEYVLYTADCAENALAVLASEKIDVLVSDMCMPGTSGAELMHEVRKNNPGVIRIIVSGRFDFTDTLEAINKGHVDHYITKPFNDKDLKLTIYRALVQKEQREAEENRRRQRRENAFQRARELGQSVAKSKQEVGRAYDQSLELLTRLVARSSSGIAKRADLCVLLAEKLGQGEPFSKQIRVAALMQDVSLVGMSPKSQSSGSGDREAFRQHPCESAELVENLTPFGMSADMIRYHHERFDGKGFPEGRKGEEIPIGARIISLVNGYYKLRKGKGISHADAIEALGSLEDRYDPRLLMALANLEGSFKPR